MPNVSTVMQNQPIVFTPDIYKNYLHQPSHLYVQNGTWIITVGTYNKQHIFKEKRELTMLQKTIFQTAYKEKWVLRAWAIFSNHYHIIAVSNEQSTPISTFMQSIHRESACLINKMQSAEGRKVWYRYWETLLTYEKSYFARLKYVMQNPVKHGLVKNAVDYPWCSAKWFSQTTSRKFYSNVERFKTEGIKIHDDF